MSVFLRKYFWLKFSAKCPGIRLVLLFCETNLIAGRSAFYLTTHVYMELWMSDNFIITLPFWYIYIYIIYIYIYIYIYTYMHTYMHQTYNKIWFSLSQRRGLHHKLYIFIDRELLWNHLYIYVLVNYIFVVRLLAIWSLLWHIIFVVRIWRIEYTKLDRDSFFPWMCCATFCQWLPVT